jgi:hypothetical protein
MSHAIKPGNKPANQRQGYKAKKLSKKFKRDRLRSKYFPIV